MTRRRESWFDDEAGPLVRPYAVVRGRTSEVRPELDVITIVVAVRSDRPPTGHEPEYANILQLCETPLSVAEVSARTHLPLLVTKILIGDLIGDGHLVFRSPATADGAGVTDINLMRAVLDGIRNF